MKNKQIPLTTLVGFILIYLTYIGFPALFSQQFFFSIHARATYPDVQLLSEKQGGDVLVCLLSMAFVYALWLLGCVRTYSPLSSAPAFALCVFWLSFSIHPYSFTLEANRRSG